MTRYLLDTNHLSELVIRPRGRVAMRVRRVGAASVCTSVIVAAELRYGALKRGAPKLSEQVEAVLGAIAIEPLQVPVDVHYARIRRDLQAAGTPIGPNDLLIASHAVQLGNTLVSANLREFRRVDGLVVDNWLDMEA